MSIKGVHAIMFGENADAIRDFLRDVVDLDYVEAGGGWPIFKLPPTELSVHPSEQSGAYELYLMCDDIETTKAELEAKGVEFTAPIRDQTWGLVTAIKVPGGGELGLYQPLHATAI